MNAIPSNCIVTKLYRQQMQGNDVMSLLYFDIDLYHLRTKRDTGSRDLNTARLVILLYNLAVFKSLLPVSRLVRR